MRLDQNLFLQETLNFKKALGIQPLATSLFSLLEKLYIFILLLLRLKIVRV
ncbi:hypothetical protein DB42_EC00140 [Neochlamydia sp. EPS4]|nr:hypothetical protein DB42_EC00140 [Neochlamydia sp. EPS4]